MYVHTDLTKPPSSEALPAFWLGATNFIPQGNSEIMLGPGNGRALSQSCTPAKYCYVNGPHAALVVLLWQLALHNLIQHIHIQTHAHTQTVKNVIFKSYCLQ